MLPLVLETNGFRIKRDILKLGTESKQGRKEDWINFTDQSKVSDGEFVDTNVFCKREFGGDQAKR